MMDHRKTDKQRAEIGTDRPQLYRIQVRGRLGDEWAGWFDGLSMSHQVNHEGKPITVLSGSVVDQSALQGVLRALHTLGLSLISVEQLGAQQPERSE